jgi:hypothetical protein
MALADRAGLHDLVGEHDRPGGDCGANPHLKVVSLVAGMAAGADSIDDMGVLRHGAMGAVFNGIRVPSTLGSHLRAYNLGNVAQLEKASRKLLIRLAREAPLLRGARYLAFIDIDSSQKRVFGYRKQGARFGVTKIASKQAKVRGLNPAGRGGEHAGLGPGDRRDPPPGRPVLRHHPHERQDQGRDRRHRRGRLDPD